MGYKKQRWSIENVYKHKPLKQCNKMWQALYTLPGWIYWLTLDFSGKNQWFNSVRFLLLYNSSHYTANILSFFALKWALDSSFQHYKPEFSAPTLSSMYRSDHSNMTALFTSALPSEHCSTQGFFSWAFGWLHTTKGTKTLLFSMLAGHGRQPLKCSLKTPRSDWNVLIPSTQLMVH